MKHVSLLPDWVNVAFLAAQLEQNPDLWDSRTLRTSIPGGPFDGTSDIWLRYRDPSEVKEPKQWNEPHEAVWYPEAQPLSAAKVIARKLCERMGMNKLGGVLITRIPPGGEVKWHTDKGGWHAHHYDRKVYVVIQGNDQCVNYFEDEQVIMRTGEAWLFDNLVRHRVLNHGDEPRVSLIVCMRKESDHVSAA